MPSDADWQLTPEGAAIHEGEKTAVIADVHLGYEWARAAAGDSVIAHSLDETLARLSKVLERATIRCLMVAGDLVESVRPCRRTGDDVRRLRTWLDQRGVSLHVLEGNHDRSLTRINSDPLHHSERIHATAEVAGWTIGHGHVPIRGERIISGHHHPVLRVDRTTAPCFLVGPRRIFLPAFSLNAAGVDVGAAALPRGWMGLQLRCVVSTGVELLDFGPLSNLRAHLRRQKR
jgi:putative SbcD/Mre11-related phosphoesterase